MAMDLPPRKRGWTLDMMDKLRDKLRERVEEVCPEVDTREGSMVEQVVLSPVAASLAADLEQLEIRMAAKLLGPTIAATSNMTPEPPKPPLTADRVIAALLKRPDLLLAVKAALKTVWVVGPWEKGGSCDWTRKEGGSLSCCEIDFRASRVDNSFDWWAWSGAPNSHTGGGTPVRKGRAATVEEAQVQVDAALARWAVLVDEWPT